MKVKGILIPSFKLLQGEIMTKRDFQGINFVSPNFWEDVFKVVQKCKLVLTLVGGISHRFADLISSV